MLEQLASSDALYLLAVTVLGPLLNDAGQTYVKGFFGRALEGFAKDKRDELAKEFDAAILEWVRAGLKSLEAGEYEGEPKAFLEEHKRWFEKFLKDARVREQLVRPWSSMDPNAGPDPEVLKRRWKELELPELPPEFDFSSTCRLFVKRLRTRQLASEELRKRVALQLASEQTGLLEALRGVWPEFERDGYAERMRKRYAVLDLSALTPPARDDVDPTPLLVRNIFIPQSARANPPPLDVSRSLLDRPDGPGLEDAPDLLKKRGKGRNGREELEHTWSRWREAPEQPVLDVIGRTQRLVLLGDPGSGKSTLARYVLLSILAPPPEPPSWLQALRGHLPLLIELREYQRTFVDGACQSFLQYLHHLGLSQGYQLNQLEVDQHLRERPALVIFDGLDEIFEPDRRRTLIRQIVGFAHQYPLARVLVTSRIVGYTGQELRSAGFEEHTLLELDRTRTLTFVDGWYRQIFPDRPEEAAIRKRRIESAIDQSPSIRQLAGNPLLLTIIAIIARHQELPRERSRLYEHAVKVLCHHWDVTGHGIPREELPADFMREDHKLELLRRIAWRMQASEEGLRGNALLEEDLRTEITTYFREKWQLAGAEAARTVDQVFDQLRTRNFILCLFGPGVYGFVHRTFLEYLCALEVQQRFERERSMTPEELRDWFVQRAREDAWHEVLRLLCGMVHTRFVEPLIQAIVPSPWNAFFDTELLVLAIQCLREVQDLQAAGETAELVMERIFDWLENVDTSSFGRSSKDPVEVFSQGAFPALDAIGQQWPRRLENVARITGLDSQLRVVGDRHQVFGKLVAAVWADRDEVCRTMMEGAAQDGVTGLFSMTALWAFIDRPEVVILLTAQARTGSDEACNAVRAGLELCPEPTREILVIASELLRTQARSHHQVQIIDLLGKAQGPLQLEISALLRQLAHEAPEMEVRAQAWATLLERNPNDHGLHAEVLHFLQSQSSLDADTVYRALSYLPNIDIEILEGAWSLVESGGLDGDIQGALMVVFQAAQTDPALLERLVTLLASSPDFFFNPHMPSLPLSLAKRDDRLLALFRACLESTTARWFMSVIFNPELVELAVATEPGTRNLLLARFESESSLAATEEELVRPLVNAAMKDEVFFRRLAGIAQSGTVAQRVGLIENLAPFAALDGEILRLLKSRAQGDEAVRVRTAAYTSLGQLVLTNREVQYLIEKALVSGPDEEIEVALMSPLAVLARYHEGSLVSLMERAEKRASAKVRLRALEGLEPFVQYRPEVLALATRIAVNDSEPESRQKALAFVLAALPLENTALLLSQVVTSDRAPGPFALALNRLPDAHPLLVTLQPVLVARAASDPDTGIRVAILRRLGELADGSHELNHLFLDRAVGDPGQVVRQEALWARASQLEDEVDQLLLSNRLDAMGPGIDLRKPIDDARVEAAARAVALSTEEVRERYAVLATIFPLKLAC